MYLKVHFVSSQGAWQSHGLSQMHSRCSCGFSRIMGSPCTPDLWDKDKDKDKDKGRNRDRERDKDKMGQGLCH